MIKHFVLFRLKDEYSREEKNEIFESMKDGFADLPEKINVLRKLEVHKNINLSEAYDIVLIAYVESKDDLKTYAEHEAHVSCVMRYVKPHLQHRAALDIWVSK